MKKCNASFDRLDALPINIIEIILMFLPLRDMVRTSILSKSWRFKWTKVPQLIFEDDQEMFRSRGGSNTENLLIVFGILLQHQGPISKLKLDMSRWCNYSGIDKIIYFLSRNGIQELNLLMSDKKFHKLPSSIFSCVELKHLSLKSCVFQPLTLVGFKFSKLVTLELLQVRLDLEDVCIAGCPLLVNLTLDVLNLVPSFSVYAPNLETLFLKGCRYCIIETPHLKALSLGDKTYNFISWWKTSEFLKLLRSLPLLEKLCLSSRYLMVLTVDDFLNGPPTVLNNLRMLQLNGIDSNVKNHISSVLWLMIENSPNLQKLEFTQCEEPTHWNPEQSLQMPPMKLREVKFELVNDLRLYVFMKFFLAICPELEILYIKPALNELNMSGCKSLLRLTCSRRASAKVEIIILGVDLNEA